MNGRVETLFRSFSVLAAFSYERMSGVGLSFVMRPLLKNLPLEKREAARRRSADYFNCHPFLSGLAASALVRAEIDGSTPEDIERFKKALIGPLGLVGDRFIWAGLFPSFAGATLVLTSLDAGLLAPILLVGAFLGTSVLIRWAGIRLGDDKGLSVGRTLGSPRIRKALAVVDAFAAFMIGVAVPKVIFWLAGTWRLEDIGGVLAVAALGIVASRGAFKRIDSLRFGLVAVGLTLLLGLVT